MGMSLGMGLGLTHTKGVGYDPIVALGADLLEYWDASIASQLTLSGAEIVTWASGKSGLAPTQGTSAARPTYSATGVNGRPCAVLDGVDDQLTVSAVGSLPTGVNPCEIWVLGSQDALAADGSARRAFAYGNGGVTGQWRGVGRTAASGVNRSIGTMGTGAADVTVTDLVSDMSGVFLQRVRCATDKISHWLNRVSLGETSGTLGGTTTTRTRIGAFPNFSGNQFWSGKIAAIYVTNLLSEPQEAALTNYFAARGGF